MVPVGSYIIEGSRAAGKVAAFHRWIAEGYPFDEGGYNIDFNPFVEIVWIRYLVPSFLLWCNRANQHQASRLGTQVYLGDEVSPVGQSIADDYEFASYEQVMTWFCNGAEFEDILVALETQSQTDVLADEMLQMLADGFTWEEIWQIIGILE